MKKLNTRSILKCLRSYVGLSKDTYATERSTIENFQGCSLGCLYRCSGETDLNRIRNNPYDVERNDKFLKYNIPNTGEVVDANDTFKGTNKQRLQFMCLWFKELARAMTQMSKFEPVNYPNVRDRARAKYKAAQ